MTVDAFNAFIQKWVTPATVVIVFGAIVWGVQLNILSLQHAQAIARNHEAVKSLDQRLTSAQFDAQKMALLLEQATQHLAAVQKSLDDHYREAEQWKRQIIRNQDAIERIDENG